MSTIEEFNPQLAQEVAAVLARRSTAGSVDCGCGCGCTGSDGLVGLERTRFFTRQLVGPGDLTQDQTYFRDKARRHNRLLHGWGIVCGARVKAGDTACEVVVESGYVLGPYGDEIVIPADTTFDVCSASTSVDACGGVDPWCTDVRMQRAAGQTMYLAVRYAECTTKPVRVTACNCGCNGDDCEYSRIRDSYELQVLTELPVSYADLERGGRAWEMLGLWGSLMCIGGPRTCPPCPSSPWVILADIQVDADGTVTVDCAPHRRYVVSFADYAFYCTDRKYESVGLFPQVKMQSLLLDTSTMAQPQEAAAPPAATVAAKTGDGRWLTVPGTFDVKPGETIGQLIAREGDRTYVDPSTGDTSTLRELYAAAGADPQATVNTVADALAPLEGANLDVAGLRIVRGAYDGLIDKKGLERLDTAHAGSPAAAPELPAEALRGVAGSSPTGKQIAGKTIAEVAAAPREAFVTDAVKGLRGPARTAESERAQAVWDAATRVAKLGRAWSS